MSSINSCLDEGFYRLGANLDSSKNTILKQSSKFESEERVNTTTSYLQIFSKRFTDEGNTSSGDFEGAFHGGTLFKHLATSNLGASGDCEGKVHNGKLFESVVTGNLSEKKQGA